MKKSRRRSNRKSVVPRPISKDILVHRVGLRPLVANLRHVLMETSGRKSIRRRSGRRTSGVNQQDVVLVMNLWSQINKT